MQRVRIAQVRRAAGDTIVEVLFAIAVLAAVLGGAYALAGNNLTAGQQAQERTEALKVAEGQVELIKASAGTTNTTLFSQARLFCLQLSGGVPSAVPFASATTLGALESENYSSYPGGCVTGVNGRYHIGIRYQKDFNSVVDQDVFAVSVRWERLGGGNDEVLIMYKAHQP